MTRWRLNFGIALLLSAAFHLALLAATPSLWHGWPAPPRQQAAQEMTVALIAPEVATAPPPPEFEMGQDKATGYGSNAAKGEQPLKAREADEDQAFLSREPRSSGRLIGSKTDLTLPGENGSGGQQGSAAAQIAVAVPSEQSQRAQPQAEVPLAPPLRLPGEKEEQVKPTIATAQEPSIEVPKVEPQPAPPAPPVRQTVAASLSMPAPLVESRPQTGDGRAPGIDPRQPDPAQQSDSESDPFAKVGSAVFHDGRLEVKNGRKVKTTRPHVLLAGQFDLLSMGTATVVLKISIDRTGKVTAVDILHSSGSNDVDQPCRVAVYEWWFEPTRDKRGNPLADTITFSIKFE